MKYLTGKDYDYLCKECRTKIDVAHKSILAGAVGIRYANDPEGPIMLVYDVRGMCGGYWCDARAADIEAEEQPQYHCVPQWSIFMVKEDWKNKIRYTLPICTLFEEWPATCFEDMASCLGWELVPFSQAAVGGYYLHPGLDIALECHPWGTWPASSLRWAVVSVLPTFDIAEWGAWDAK